MPKLRLLLARLGLLIVALYAAVRVLDPEARWAASAVRGDRVEHAVVVYVLLTLAWAALPTVRPLYPVLVMLGVGVGVELLQGAPFAAGEPQVSDVGADVAGVLAAVVPFLIGQGRGRAAVTAQASSAPSK